MTKGDDFNFLSEEDRNFVISDDEINGACDDIDLDSIASAEQKDQDELEGLTNTDTNRNRSDSDGSASADYNADIECDEDSTSRSSNYGIALDDDIVSRVLDGSNDRMKGRMNEKHKKVCKYGMMLLVGFVGFVWVLNSDFFVMRDIQQHGSAFHMNDEEKFLEKPSFNVFDFPVVVSENFAVPPAYNNIVNVRGPAYQSSKETPFFVYSQDGSTVIEDILSECLGMSIAGTNPIPSDAKKGTLQTYDSQESGRTYVNVDLATAAGIKEAGKAGLASSPLVDAIFTPLFHTGIEIFNTEFKARLYTLMRHPVDRTVSEYYTFTQNAAEEVLREMTLEEYINSKYYIGNHMTSFIGGCWSPAITDDICLQWSKELLRTKFVIGLQDDIYGAMELYEDYFFWDYDSPQVKSCKRDVIKSEFDRDFAVYQSVGERIKEDSKLYQTIVEKNSFDMELYWYAVELQKFQRAWIPRLTSSPA